MGSLLIPSDVRVETEFKILPLTEPGSGAEVSADGKTVCYWSGPRLHCLSVPSYRPVGAWHLSRSSPCSWSIRAVRFFSLDASQHLLVAAEAAETSDSHLLVLQCGRTAPLKRIRLPHRAACLAVLSVPDCPQPAAICGPLLGAFAGCAAVGCHSGHVMLVDLRLDDEDFSIGGAGADIDESVGAALATGAESASTSTSAGASAAAAAAAPAQLMPMRTLAAVAATQSPADAVARLRDAACDNGGHLYCLLDDNLLTSGSCFKYKKTNGDVWQAFSADSVSVTALHSAKLIASLLVGFSFGGAQIWRLVDGFHELTCKIDMSSPPVSHFVLLKADDDPMNLLYLWICRGSRELSTPSTIVLYQLKYKDRKSLSGSQSDCSSGNSASTVNQFVNLLCAGVSFSHCLALSGGDSTLSRLIHCDNLIARPVNSSDDNLSRAYFIWTECSSSVLHVGVFDLNRWYQCQLPRTAKYSLRQLHPYFAVHRLELQRHLLSSGLRLLGGLAPTVLAATVVPDSAAQFQPGLNWRPGATPPEQLFYPASIGYRVRLHCPPHALLLRCDSAQRAHLDLIGRLSPDSLMARADELADRCVQLGLLLPPPSTSPSTPTDNSDDIDADSRRRLLTVCLEHGRDDALPALGCGQYAGLVVDWLWASVRRYKRLLDSATASLFRVDPADDEADDDGEQSNVDDAVIEDVDAESVASDSRIVQLVSLLDRLDNLLRRLLDCRPSTTTATTTTTTTTTAAVADLRYRADAVARLCAYAKRLQWCARARLLPPARLAPIFAELAGRVADARRCRSLAVDCLVERLFNPASSDGDCVDIDANNDGEYRGLDDSDSLSVAYPPADARHLLESVFLRAPAGCDPRLQHCLFAYLLMDLQALLEDADDAEELTEQWDGYLSVSGQPASLARWANLLWSLDHSLWPEAMSLLDDPDLSRPLFPGLADGLVSALADSAPSVAARCLIRFRQHAAVSPSLAIRVLLASGRPDLALDLVIRPAGDAAERADLLNRLLDECAASERWRAKLFLGINWRQEELPGLTDFAAKSGSQQIKEQLVAHLLLTGRYAEAAQLSDRLPVCDEASAARKRLVDIVLNSLPRVQRDLLRLEIAQQQQQQQQSSSLLFPTRRTVDPRQLAAQPIGPGVACVNPFGTSVTTEKLLASVVATRERERQAWLKAVQSDRPSFFRGLLSNVFMTPNASAAGTNNYRPAFSLSTVKKRVCSPVLTNPRSAKLPRREPAADGQLLAAASPGVRGQCDQLLRTPCRLGNSHRKPQQSQRKQQQQQQQQQEQCSRASRFHFSSTSRPVVSILRKTVDGAERQLRSTHSPAPGRLRFADSVECSSPDVPVAEESRAQQLSGLRPSRLMMPRRQPTPGLKATSSSAAAAEEAPAPIPLDLDETSSFDSPSDKQQQQQQQNKDVTRDALDVEMVEATTELNPPLEFSEPQLPPPQHRQQQQKVLKFSSSIDEASSSEAATSPTSSSDVFVTPEDTSPVVEQSPPAPVAVPTFSPAPNAAPASPASPVASMARSDLLRRSHSPAAESAPNSAPELESSFSFAKPLTNIRLAAVHSATLDTAAAGGFVFSPPSTPGQVQVRLIRPAQHEEEEQEEVSMELSKNDSTYLATTDNQQQAEKEENKEQKTVDQQEQQQKEPLVEETQKEIVEAEAEDDNNFEPDSFFTRQPQPVPEQPAVVEEEYNNSAVASSHTKEAQPAELTPSSPRQKDAESSEDEEEEKEKEEEASTRPKTRRAVGRRRGADRKLSESSEPPAAVSRLSRTRRASKMEETAKESANDDKDKEKEEEETVEAASPEMKSYELRRRASMSAPPTPTQPPPLRRSSRRASVQSIDKADLSMSMPPPAPSAPASSQQSTPASTAATVTGPAGDDDPLNTSASSLDSELSIASAPAGPVRRSSRLRGRRQHQQQQQHQRFSVAASSVVVGVDDLPALPEEAATSLSPQSTTNVDVTGSSRRRRRVGRVASRSSAASDLSVGVGVSPDDSVASEAAAGSQSSVEQSSRRQRRRGVGESAKTSTTGRRAGLRSRDK